MSVKSTLIAATAIALLASACAHTSGTQPHDMSVPEHEAAATREDTKAEEHAAEHDPTQEAPRERCSGVKGRVCWTDMVNPTDEHQRVARQHRDAAAKHRAAAQALKDTEAKACDGITEEDRDMSPFAHSDDVREVSALEEERPAGKSKTVRQVGATVVFRAMPGLTAEWLQRIVDCHLARNAALGHDMPEMAYCPLVPRGVTAKVRSVGDGFAVEVRSDDPETAKQILARAQGIKKGAP